MNNQHIVIMHNGTCPRPVKRETLITSRSRPESTYPDVLSKPTY